MTMRTSLKRLLMLVCTAIVLCSCTDYSKIVFSDFRVSSVDSLKYSLTDLRAIVNSSLTVDNPYFAMKIKDFAAEVVDPEGKAIADVKVEDGVVLDINAKSKTELQAPLRVHVSNPMRLLALGVDAVRELGEEGYVVNYSLAASRGGKFHKINKKNIPLDSFIKTEE